MGELRRVVEHLRPDELADLGLEASLERMVNDRQRINPNIQIVFHSDRNGRRLDPDAELAVYRVVQEALTNSIKHAGAKTIEIDLTEADASIIARVRDDGCGFDVGQARRTASGSGGCASEPACCGASSTSTRIQAEATEVALRLPAEPA